MNFGKNLIRLIQQAQLPEVVRDTDLALLIPGTPARRHNIVKRALASGDLCQIRRGLYVVGKPYQNKKIHPFQLAQWIYGPSYISLESALSYWDLIPEATYTVTSGTSKRSKEFHTPYGEFAFQRIPYSPLYMDVKRIDADGGIFFIAKPWRALADYVYVSGNQWTLRDLAEFLRLEPRPKIEKTALSRLRRFYRNQRVERFIDSCAKEPQ